MLEGPDEAVETAGGDTDGVPEDGETGAAPEGCGLGAEPRGREVGRRRPTLRAPNLFDFPCAVQRFTCWLARWVADG